jgi:hypothetical protein
MPKSGSRRGPVSRPRLSLLRQFRKAVKWVALFSIAIAAIAMLLVARGDEGAHIPMLIAIALGAGLSVLLAGALMSLVFLSANGGHEEATNRFGEDEHP